jgi:mono/diheme cytochrome c family protein
LAELQARLGVGASEISDVTTIKNGALRAISISAHSTALGKRSVSAINPRLVAVHLGLRPAPQVGRSGNYASFFALAFARGEQFAELLATDREEDRINFYVVSFRQPCNALPEGCLPGDLLTDAIESSWSELTLYDEADLTNTVLDCATCHQPNGPGTPKLLRMQELDSPWTHWFSPTTEGGKVLLEDYMAAHGDETYAGMSAAQIARADPNSLATMVFLGNPTQPNEFDSLIIETEVKESAAAMGGNQPFDNSIPGASPTWSRAFAAAMSGAFIAVPYLNVKVSDPVKLADMTSAYQAYRSGQLAAAELPDIRDVFPSDPERLAEMGIGTGSDLDGASVLLSACAQCHNSRLDQTLSRARFRADLQGVSRAEKEVAIARMQLPPEHPLAMPPARLRVLTQEARERALAVLRE